MDSSMSEGADLTCFKELLLRTCGHTFEKEREQALSAALCRRMAALVIDSTEKYYALLLFDVAELLRLTELLTVNETYFFREHGHLNLMVDKLLPELMAARKGSPIRILSAGCSTGEEPYTIAIMLRERFGSDAEKLFTITGVDIDSTVIASAQLGVYGRGSFRGMNQALLERYFESTAVAEFEVKDFLKKQVQFEIANLLGTSYPPGMRLPDIILYRNVSIYFPGQVQREIFARLADILVEGGILLVGASETFHHDTGILSLIQQDALFFYRKAAGIVFEERRASNRHTPTSERRRGTVLQTPPVHGTKFDLHQNRMLDRRNNENSHNKLNIRESFDEAISLTQNKEQDKALGLLDALIEQDSTFTKAYCLRGSLLLSLSRFDEARVVCETILSLDPLSLVAYLMLGMIERQHRNDDDAIKRFREAIYLDSSCWLAHFYFAEIMFAQKDTKRARSSYEAAARILERGPLQLLGQAFFPLSFNAEQFAVICRHKLSLLTPTHNKG